MKQPNILFLLSDEHGFRYLSHVCEQEGGEPVRTPNLFGRGCQEPVQDDALKEPSNIYGQTKLACEHLLRFYAQHKGVDGRALRFTWVFGPGRSTGITAAYSSLLLDAAARDQAIDVPNPEETGDWLYVKDAVKALLLDAPAAPQRIYNIAGGVHSIRDVLNIVKKLKPTARIVMQPGGKALSPYPAAYDDAPARRELGWRPDYTIETAVAKKWFHNPVSRLRARRRPIRKAEQPQWVVSICERPATPHPGVRRGYETTSNTCASSANGTNEPGTRAGTIRENRKEERDMKDVLLDYGDGKMSVELPDTATVVQYGKSYTDPPAVDPAEAVRNALKKPLGFPPLRELSGPSKKIVIAFPDRVKGGFHDQAHRKVSIPIIIEELLAGGARIENITLLCAMGLHRQNTLDEWYAYLGKELVNRFYPGRIVNHDAEAPDLMDFGLDDMGNRVQCNRLIGESDLPIVVGHCAGNPYGGYSGGYKMVVTGLVGWRSTASHHTPGTMHRDDWLGSSTKQHMRKQFASIGQAIEKGIRKKFFAVDAVIGQKSQVLGVWAGAISEVEQASWPLADRRTNVQLDMAEPADILVFGLPRNFHYGPGMGTNPILMSLAIGVQLSRCWGAFREGGVIIAPTICDGWFNANWFPSYEETYNALKNYVEPEDFLASADAERISTDPEWRFRYSNYYKYHPFHAMSMISGGAVPRKRTSAVFLPGAQKPDYARGMGFTPVKTFTEAMERAVKIVGKNPKILCTPECFSGGVTVHLHLNK